MKTKTPSRLHAAFALALLAILGTVALGVLLWFRFSILRYRLVPFLVPFLVPLWFFNLAFFPSSFYVAIYGLLGFNVLCCLGALWLALKR